MKSRIKCRCKPWKQEDSKTCSCFIICLANKGCRLLNRQDPHAIINSIKIEDLCKLLEHNFNSMRNKAFGRFTMWSKEKETEQID